MFSDWAPEENLLTTPCLFFLYLALLSTLAFFVVGLFLLTTVDEKRGRKAATTFSIEKSR